MNVKNLTDRKALTEFESLFIYHIGITELFLFLAEKRGVTVKDMVKDMVLSEMLSATVSATLSENL